MKEYKRVLIKLSGEVLGGGSFGIDHNTVKRIVSQIAACAREGIEIAIVIGGGNFWRGRNADSRMDKTTADHMGMLATAINALALQDALEEQGIPTRVQTALPMINIAEPYILRKALRHFEKKRVVIFACGTGNPYFTTDSGAALRAAEIHAEVLLLAKNVDGVYDSDPNKNPDAKKFSEITYEEFIARNLSAMDITAVNLCRENSIPIVAFGLNEENSITRVMHGETLGTLIH